MAEQQMDSSESWRSHFLHFAKNKTQDQLLPISQKGYGKPIATLVSPLEKTILQANAKINKKKAKKRAPVKRKRTRAKRSHVPVKRNHSTVNKRKTIKKASQSNRRRPRKHIKRGGVRKRR